MLTQVPTPRDTQSSMSRSAALDVLTRMLKHNLTLSVLDLDPRGKDNLNQDKNDFISAHLSPIESW
jgi:hypothetical protein